jgi:hypothetical protein
LRKGITILLKKQRVSFDFDGTLSTRTGKDRALFEMKKGNDVYIVTARRKENGKDVYAVADQLGIDKSHVVFTEGEDKWTYLLKHEIDKHYDNNKEQIRKIKTNTNIQAELWQ